MCMVICIYVVKDREINRHIFTEIKEFGGTEHVTFGSLLSVSATSIAD
jgi:hypothetical protein